MHTLTSVQREQLDRCLNGIEHLPPAPVHMINLINLFQQPDRDVDEIVDLLLQEPALAAEILRRCNSSFFGNEEPVTEISEAMFRLGFYEIYRLTVTLFGSKAMSAPKVGAFLDVEEIWRHCTMTAIVGGAIARELGGDRRHRLYRRPFA